MGGLPLSTKLDGRTSFALPMSHVLTFERSVVTLLTRIDELRVSSDDDPKVISEIERLEAQAGELVRELYANLTPMQKVLLSRHPSRPYSLDYIERLTTNWIELHGDRRYADDSAIVAGLGTYRGRSVVVVGQQKGRSTKENVKRNFGMASPEGYRKALRLYDMADRFGLPIITFIDTAGAYPGIGAEERGQSEAIAACLEKLASVRVPVISVVIGEGGSGGALALGVGNRVLVLEYAYYSVITPEGCAAILWKDPNKIAEAAARLKITANDLACPRRGRRHRRRALGWCTSRLRRSFASSGRGNRATSRGTRLAWSGRVARRPVRTVPQDWHLWVRVTRSRSRLQLRSESLSAHEAERTGPSRKRPASPNARRGARSTYSRVTAHVEPSKVLARRTLG
ncbi:MAG: acetyl-CoA carboxylase carboxyltransferase subunit alpha [Polyangiaceae bacterium]